MPLTSDSELRQVLEQARTVAVVGFSQKPWRPSAGVARALQSFGLEVYAVNPTQQSTPERRIYTSLSEIPVPIDIVDIFRRPEFVPDVIEAAIAVHAKVIWMQLGIVNEEAARRAEEAGLKVVMNRCLKIDYARLIGVPH